MPAPARCTTASNPSSWSGSRRPAPMSQPITWGPVVAPRTRRTTEWPADVRCRSRAVPINPDEPERSTRMAHSPYRGRSRGQAATSLVLVGAVFIDLDRTLLRGASGPALQRALVAQGVMRERGLPGDRLLYTVYERLGENLLSMGMARSAARLAKGWPQSAVIEAAE